MQVELEPEQPPPDQPPALYLGSGVAVKVTAEPSLYSCSQSPFPEPQFMPSPVIFPLPGGFPFSLLTVNFFLDWFIVKLKVTLLLFPPPEAVTVTEWFPAGTDAVVEMVRVVEALGVMLLGENEEFAPEGSPDTEKLTDLATPLVKAIDSVLLIELPLLTEKLLCDWEREKSNGNSKKFAVIFLSLFIVTAQLFSPEESHPLKLQVYPGAGEAVKVTAVPDV